MIPETFVVGVYRMGLRATELLKDKTLSTAERAVLGTVADGFKQSHELLLSVRKAA